MELAKRKYLFYIWPILFLLGLAFANHWKTLPLQSLLIGSTAAVLGLLLALFKKDLLFSICIFFIPLSLNMGNILPGGVMAFPSELIAILVAGIFLIYGSVNPINDLKIWRHPITILLLLDISWLCITSFASEMPIVSFKRVLMRVIFFLTFYCFAAHWMVDLKRITKYLYLLCLGLLIPIFNTTLKHAGYGFDPRVVFDISKPFFTDHTIYGAAIAFVLPFGFLLVWNRKLFEFSKRLSRMTFLILIFLLLGEFLSFSRASWLSLIGAIGVYVMLKLRLKFWVFLVVLAGVVTTGWFFSETIYVNAINNRNVSNTGELSEQVMSVNNLNTDASNLERLNRWKSALRMFEDKPLTGFGPGTYQFIYGPYQSPHEMTYISTLDGNKGNAHSELLTYLSETGLPGALLAFIWFLVVIAYGFRAYYKMQDKRHRVLLMAALLGFITFFVHGLVNSFIDQVKMAGFVFGAMAIITVLDVNKRKIFGEESKA